MYYKKREKLTFCLYLLKCLYIFIHLVCYGAKSLFRQMALVGGMAGLLFLVGFGVCDMITNEKKGRLSMKIAK